MPTAPSTARRICSYVVLFFLVVFFGGGLFVDWTPDTRKREPCGEHLVALGNAFRDYREAHPGQPEYDGVAMFLAFRVKTGQILRGEELLFVCPGDDQIQLPVTPEAMDLFDDVDLTDPPAHLCSFAVRDFTAYPLDPYATEPEILACDRNGSNGRVLHHRDGLNVLFTDGSVRFMTRADLGLSRDGDVMVGPKSEHEMLRKVRYR